MVQTKIVNNFDCSLNELINLNGCPEKISGNFSCSNNKLKNLIGWVILSIVVQYIVVLIN